MKSRAERNREIETIKSNIFEAGVSVLKAARASEDLFDTSINALAEAMDIHTGNSAQEKPLQSIHEILTGQIQAAEVTGDVDAYLEAVEKLEFLEDVEIRRIERIARRLEAQIRVQTAEQQLKQLEQTPSSRTHKSGEKNCAAEPNPQVTPVTQITPSPVFDSKVDDQWTESKLKKKFKNLGNLGKTLGQEPKSWKDAVNLANQLKLKL